MGFFAEYIEEVKQIITSFDKEVERVKGSVKRADEIKEKLEGFRSKLDPARLSLLNNLADAVDVAKNKEFERLKHYSSGGSFEDRALLLRQIEIMKKSRIIKVDTAQLSLFTTLPMIDSQDYRLLKSPFDVVFIEPINGSLVDKEYETYEVQIKGLLIASLKDPEKLMYCDVIKDNKEDFLTWDVVGKEFKLAFSEILSMFQVTVFIPLKDSPFNAYIVTVAVKKDGTLYYPYIDMGDDLVFSKGDVTVNVKFSKKMVRFIVHILNFLTSPAVVLDEKEHSVELQKARAKRGKEPLPGWYEISYKHTYTKPREIKEGHEPAFKHGFRYDVRGHFMHFRKGRMAGRVIWCPPHQRGLANTLYKPKTYRVTENELPEQPTIYQGGS